MNFPRMVLSALLSSLLLIGFLLIRELRRPAPEFPATAQPLSRPDITFLIGSDSETENPYFAKAAEYYRLDEEEGAEWVITDCKTLQEVNEYLRERHLGRPWGRIQLVMHGNEWTGMGVPITASGRRTSAAQLWTALEQGQLKPLPDSLLDARSEIHLQACALGRDEPLLQALAFAFGGFDEQRPRLYSSRYFVGYTSAGGPAGRSRKYLADYWYAFYPKGRRPGDIRLSRQLAQRYPDAGISWREALARTEPRRPGDLFHYTIDIPVVWTVTYPDSIPRPPLRSEREKDGWWKEQHGLQDVLKRMDLSREQFSWYFREITHTDENGVEKPAIKAIGLCSVVLVLRAFTEAGGAELLQPAPDDSLFYTVVM